MDQLSSGTDDITSETGLTIASATTLPMTSPSYSTMTVTYSQVSYIEVYYQTSDQSLSLIENNNLIVTPDLTCSPSGVTSIAYSLASYNGATVPSWISINSSSGQLTVTAPYVDSDTEYDFYINSSITGVSTVYQKIIKLTVKNWKVTMWLKCKSTDVNIWELYQVSAQAQALVATSQSIVGATSGITAASSMMNSSSLTSLWSMINQVQMFFMLLLTRSFIPHEIEVTITGQGFAINPSDYIPFKSIGSSERYIDKFKFDLSNSQLETFGIESDSSFYNVYPTISSLLTGVAIHIFLYTLSKIVFKWRSNRWPWFIKFLKWIINKILNILTFGFYIRTLLETNQFLLISSINEIYQFNTYGAKRIISLIFAFFVLYICIMMFVFVFYLTFSSYKMKDEGHSKLGEFFAGLKLQKKFRVYVLFLIARRTIFVIVLVTFVSFSSTTVTSILSVLQAIYILSLILLRPFDETKGNLIETINEFYLFLLIFPLVFLTIESKWVGPISTIYMWTLSSNSIVVFLIILGNLLN